MRPAYWPEPACWRLWWHPEDAFPACSSSYIERLDADGLLFVSSLISPLGHHRKEYIAPSKGKRARAREKKASGASIPAGVVPPPPELAAFVDVGLANITRVLETASSRGDNQESQLVPLPYSAVFIARSGQPSAFHSHFPQMVAVASTTHSDNEPIRLVGFSQACEARLSACLGLPRASSVALRVGAPQSKALVDFVRARVRPVEVSWVHEAQEGRYRETKINTTETTVGSKKPSKS